MIRRRRPFHEVAAGQPAGEADPHPAARKRGLRQRRWHQIVEQPVQVRQRDVYGHAGNRLLRRGAGLDRRARHKLAAARSASVRFVRSQRKSGSSRPKCP